MDGVLKMKKFNKIILFKGDIETLGYFSEQLAGAFLMEGYEVYVFDFANQLQGILDLTWFAESGNTVMITFNFSGINQEEIFVEENGLTFWENHDILCVNIIVDHPFYYHEHLKHLPPRYKQFCIDKQHLAYMKRFFPEIDVVSFLPLAGTRVSEHFIPYEDRTMDLVMTGNYTPPHQFDSYINRIDEEYAAFYHGILDDLITHPSIAIEAAIERHAVQAMGNLSDSDLMDCMSNMIFIDLYVRFHFRGQAVKMLADNGFKIHVFGKGWDQLDCLHKENIIQGGGINSHQCLQKIMDSRISLNIMPWFKDGAHDRIFNSMLNKAVCLTDGSTYLESEFTSGEDLAFFSLDQLDSLPGLAEDLLQNPKRAVDIAENGYQKAINAHTWHHRAQVLSKLI